MDWEHVLDCKGYWGDRDKFAEFARQSHYRFFNWNGEIYFLSENGTYEETGLTVGEHMKRGNE